MAIIHPEYQGGQMLVLIPLEKITCNGKKDSEDKNLRDSVAHNLLVAFSNLNPDCQKIAAHARYSYGDSGGLFGLPGFSGLLPGDGYHYDIRSDSFLDYHYDISGSFAEAVVPEEFSFEYGGKTYRISIKFDRRSY